MTTVSAVLSEALTLAGASNADKTIRTINTHNLDQRMWKGEVSWCPIRAFDTFVALQSRTG